MTKPIRSLDDFIDGYLKYYLSDANMRTKIYRVRDAFSVPVPHKNKDQSDEDFERKENSNREERNRFITVAIKMAIEEDDLERASKNFWLLWLINPLEAALVFHFLAGKMDLEYHYLIKYSVLFNFEGWDKKIINYPNNYAVLLISAMFSGEFPVENLIGIYDIQLEKIYEWDKECNTNGKRKIMTKRNLWFILDRIKPYYRVYILLFYYEKYSKYLQNCYTNNIQVDVNSRSKVDIILENIKRDSVSMYTRLIKDDSDKISSWEFQSYEKLKEYATAIDDKETIRIVFGEDN